MEETNNLVLYQTPVLFKKPDKTLPRIVSLDPVKNDLPFLGDGYNIHTPPQPIEGKENYGKIISNTPGTTGGPGGRDRTLAVKSRKTAENQFFFIKKI